MVDHDHSYKLLFSHSQIVRDLLEAFVREDWLAELDYAARYRFQTCRVFTALPACCTPA